MCRKLSPSLVLTKDSQKTYTDKYCFEKTRASWSHAAIFLLILNLTLLSVGATNTTTTIEKDSKPRSVRQSLMAIDPEIQAELNAITDRIAYLNGELDEMTARVKVMEENADGAFNGAININDCLPDVGIICAPY